MQLCMYVRSLRIQLGLSARNHATDKLHQHSQLSISFQVDLQYQQDQHVPAEMADLRLSLLLVSVMPMLTSSVVQPASGNEPQVMQQAPERDKFSVVGDGHGAAVHQAPERDMFSVVLDGEPQQASTPPPPPPHTETRG